MHKISTLIVAGIIAIASQPANAIVIDFNYDYDGGFFSGANESRRTFLNTAGSLFETRLSDNLDASTSFSAGIGRPDNGDPKVLPGFSVSANTLIVFVGGRDLPGLTIGQGEPGVSFPPLGTRGQGPAASDFGPWGGSITFDTSTSWYFDSDVSNIESALSGNTDFYSVAIHELGHILGYGPADTWKNLYGGPDGTIAHWTEGTMSLFEGISQEAAMDPTLTTGTRKYFTDLDFQGLTDIGWEVTAVPVPATAYLLGSAMLGLAGFRRKS